MQVVAFPTLSKNLIRKFDIGIEGLADTIFSDLNSDTTLEMKEGTNLKADGKISTFSALFVEIHAILDLIISLLNLCLILFKLKFY